MADGQLTEAAQPYKNMPTVSVNLESAPFTELALH
jgi:hypothetical protein